MYVLRFNDFASGIRHASLPLSHANQQTCLHELFAGKENGAAKLVKNA
jgi:hypothetical protein